MKQKTINILLLILVVILIIIPSIWYVNKTHNDDLWLVVNKEVVEAANKCQNEDKCNEETVSLEYLINNGYIDKIYNPITKEAINTSSYVIFKTGEFKIVN